jgi:hypothetical protein
MEKMMTTSKRKVYKTKNYPVIYRNVVNGGKFFEIPKSKETKYIDGVKYIKVHDVNKPTRDAVFVKFDVLELCNE